jgi:lysine decarboxylase/arginine decarboxylase
MMISGHQWPVLIVSGQFDAANDEGLRLRELVRQLTEVQGGAVLSSLSYEDAHEVFISRADLGALVIDWDLPEEDPAELMSPELLLEQVRRRNPRLPVFLLTDRLGVERIPTGVLARVSECLWKTADTPEFVAGRIEARCREYVRGVYPAFFGELVEYAREYKYAWHTPGHMGGQGFLRSPAGVALHRFFGENVLRADLSISVPELGSLLDHSGAVDAAERNSARAFGADLTFYVLNGTSTVNQIIWHSQVLRDDIALVDRNCHKSLNYAMVITEASPVYLVPRRNQRGVIGPCRLEEFSEASIRAKIQASPLISAERKGQPVVMSALTNSTYDGLCYNVGAIKSRLEGSVLNLHFDEAWYAYACFHPLYAGHFGMADFDLPGEHPPVFCSQSTHKLLTAFSQASMLHVHNGTSRAVDRDHLNESYMMHGSTSPQYNMIASLDVATKMMADGGEMLLGDIIAEAVALRQTVARIAARERASGGWFFDMWQPAQVAHQGRMVPFWEAPAEMLSSRQEPWVLGAANDWHGFADIEEDYVMLDPIKLTFLTPGLAEDGAMAGQGIPASVVTDYLMRHGVVCEKSDYYSFLLLNSLGATKAKQGTLLAALLKFKELYDANAPLREVLPELVAAFPEAYGSQGLADHCHAMHAHLREHRLLEKMQAAFQVIPRPAMKPAQAYHQVVRGNVEWVDVADMAGRVPAVMLVPYPPGIPVMMGGEAMDDQAAPVLEYLLARQDFENAFPGHQSDIHGVERAGREGASRFRTMCLKQT